MRVVRQHAPGGPQQLALEETDRPRPGLGEALVRVHAAGITRDGVAADYAAVAAELLVLIHGAAGGVGGFAVQLARTAGARVIGTASAAHMGSVLERGAHEVINAATGFGDAMEPVDGVFDTVGGGRLRRSLGVLRAGGRLVSVAEEPPDGGVFFSVAPNRDQLMSISRLADSGDLRPGAVEVYPLTSAREAFARSLERDRLGKVVLAVAG